MRMSSMFRLPPWKNTVPSQVGANGKTRSSRLPLSNQSIDSFQKVVDESSPIVYSWAISQDSIVRVCVEIFTPTLTSTLPVAELAEVPQSISESVAELAEALSAPSNLYGIRYPFSSIFLSASSSRCLAVDISKWNTDASSIPSSIPRP